MCSRGCRTYLSLLPPPVSTRSKSLGNRGGRSRAPSRWQETWQDGFSSLPDCSSVSKLHTWTNIYTFTLYTDPHSLLFLCSQVLSQRILLLVEVFPFPPPKMFKETQSQQKGLNQEKTHCFQKRHIQYSWDSTVCSHMMPHEVQGGGRNLCCCCCCCSHCDCSRCKQGASKSAGVLLWQLSKVLKFTPKELWQWKFLGEKRTKENSWLELIDMKSLQCNNRWTVELLTVKERSWNSSKEKRTVLFSSQVALISWLFVVSVNFWGVQSGLKICYSNEVATSG